MSIEIQKLSVELVNDWLGYFDHDCGDWPGCYCMCYHWNSGYSARYDWNTEVFRKWDGSSEVHNRHRAVDLIKQGIMQGYLAYYDGVVIGWCNANDRSMYNSTLFQLPKAGNNEKVKSVVCFSVAPAFRNKGIATALLKKLCLDAATDGYDYVEAYPFTYGEHNNYHGSTSLYLRNGFDICGEINSSIGCCTIVRKQV